MLQGCVWHMGASGQGCSRGLLCARPAAGPVGHAYLEFSSHGCDEQHHSQPCQPQLAGPNRWQPLQGRQSQIHAGLKLLERHH